MDVGRFPVDLVLFGMIAAFLILRLRSILGRRTGFERPPVQNFTPPGPVQGPTIEGRAEPPAGPARPVPDPQSTLGKTLDRMRSIDRSFDPATFLSGAEGAFRIIVAAFAQGNRNEFRNLVGDDVFNSFDLAIAAREQAGHTQTSEVQSIEGATIENATLRGTVAQITVRFLSDQISLTKDAQGHIVAGTDAVTEIVDLWAFDRDLSARDPAWRLVSVNPG